jgi:cytosine/adenosine deaminase-related metal-dependent hydrolase
MKSSLPTIHTASWVVPVNRPPFRNGAVAIADNTITAVGELPLLQQLYPDARHIDYPQAIITPALVNGHIHLELSHLNALSNAPHESSFTDWIIRLLNIRDSLGADGEQAMAAAKETAIAQYRSGVQVIADIGNTSIGHEMADAFPGIFLAHREYLGLAEWTLDKNCQRLETEHPSVRCSGHAPYSTHPQLLQRIKARANELGHIFPIHTAEPVAEGEMIRQGRGEMVEFIRQRGFWDQSFQPRGSGGSVNYLYDLGVLDERTVCVHAIHVSDEEIRVLAGEGVKICLCPGSNRFLRTGTAPVLSFLDHGILPTLGTDSLASNPELSLWREMQIVAETFPEIDLSSIFRMATLGGAQALGVENSFGTLEPGKSGNLLAIPASDACTSEDEVYRLLVLTGANMDPQRLTQ